MSTFTLHKPDIRGTISLIGRTMITLGLILLLFVAYQLWGTNVFEQHSQNKLRSQFETKLKVANKATTTTSSTLPGDEEDDSTVTTKPSVDALAALNVREGQAIAQMEIPKIGLDHIVVSGTGKGDLQKGPGHYTSTPLPGQFGNSAIAGHRTTYGAPFNRLDELAVGDKIILTTVQGTFTYKVNKAPFTVKPTDVSVINPTTDPADPTGKTLLATLTLTTCHPKYSAAQRLIIKAELVPNDVGRATVATQLTDKDGQLPSKIDIGEDGTQNASGIGHSNILVAMTIASFHVPLLWWLLMLMLVGGLWWYFFHQLRTWKVWVIGVVPFTIVLLLYFIHLEHALPSNI